MAFVEPFRIKIVEPLPNTTRDERLSLMLDTGYNPFQVPDRMVTLDLWTDSGASAMSNQQWAAMIESQEGSFVPDSYVKLKQTIQSLTGFPYILPVNQGRVAEHALFSILVKPGFTVFSNTFYSTTKTNAELVNAKTTQLPCTFVDGGLFNGNIDCEKLEEELARVELGNGMVVLTLTSNNQAGQPISMANMKRASEICHDKGIRVFMDGCRFAENAYFIKIRDKTYANSSARDIALEMFSYFDGFYLSAKKDGLCNIGGLIAVRDGDLFATIRGQLNRTVGKWRLGGMATRDLDAIAIGLLEGIEDSYLKYRIETLTQFGDLLKKAGVSIVEPVGSALYINAAKCLPHIPTHQYPAWALNCALFVEGGIRGAHGPNVLDVDDRNDRESHQHFVKLCIPRRAYTLSHLLFIADIFKQIIAKKERVSGMRIVGNGHYYKVKTAPVEAVLINV
ncbi:tryptophanase-like [Haliotis rufescens]|uniref:tryptophanase-like n=1 Tax=Haliotis rufescens TaxID=6454 RepID=UPI00201F1264|nr:tryptophanase-like [Haliotis rufescens]